MSNQIVTIHCQPSLLNDIEALRLPWHYSQDGHDEIDVLVEDVEFNSLTQDPDVLLCRFYQLDYNQVNCIEAM